MARVWRGVTGWPRRSDEFEGRPDRPGKPGSGFHGFLGETRSGRSNLHRRRAPPLRNLTAGGGRNREVGGGIFVAIRPLLRRMVRVTSLPLNLTGAGWQNGRWVGDILPFQRRIGDPSEVATGIGGPCGVTGNIPSLRQKEYPMRASGPCVLAWR